MSEDKYDKFNKALSSYYTIKNQYTKKLITKKNKIINDSALGQKEKRQNIKKIKKQCVNCKRQVDMIFVEKGNQLVAKCGDVGKPCKLHIELDKGYVVNISKEIETLKKKVENNMLEIIKTKLDLLFNFINEEKAIQEFELKKENYEKSKKIFHKYKQLFQDVTDNDRKKEILREKLSEIYNHEKEINLLLQKYRDEEKNQFVVEIIQIYKNSFLPKIKEMREIKYVYENMLFDKKEDNYTSEQMTFTDKELEIYINEPKIISYKK